MKFGYTIAYVADVTATIEFWERAFGLTRRFVADPPSYGELETGGTTLSFAQDELAASNLPEPYRPNRSGEAAAGFEVGLLTDDVPAAYEQAVAAGATAWAPPKTKPWGQVVAYVRDLNGILVEICTPM